MTLKDFPGFSAGFPTQSSNSSDKNHPLGRLWMDVAAGGTARARPVCLGSVGVQG